MIVFCTVDMVESTQIHNKKSVKLFSFTIVLWPTSNNEEFEHTLKIVDYKDTDTGSFFTADYYLDYGNQSFDNKFINALNNGTRLSHANPDVDSVAVAIAF